jgi:hypothetical protein
MTNTLTTASTRHNWQAVSAFARDTTPPARGRIRVWALPLALSLTALLAPCLPAADYTQPALDRAHSFLRTEARGREVLSFVHSGADYHGHKYVETIPLDYGFALVYRFWWEDDGVTDVAFLCDPRGNLSRVQIMSTNAFLSQPFLVANASIAVLGHSLIELYKDKLSDDDRRQLHDLVNKADAKGLLEFRLRLEQLLD